jgi:hypothetical protein
MKSILLMSLVLILFTKQINSQVTWIEHTLTTDFDGAHSVFAEDIDGDGDIDVVGAAILAHTISWWENDGDQNFTAHAVDEDFYSARLVIAADVNSDGEMDILGAAHVSDEITWWENDGDENFTEHTVDGDFDGASSVHAKDVDGDGDIDVLGAAAFADDITWWENDGDEYFTERTIAGNFDGANSVYAEDVDGDGDIDVLGAAHNANAITWWENDGDENFAEHVISNSFNYSVAVYAEDVNGDGNMDVLGAANTGDDITWWENDGNENFTEHTIGGEFDGPESVYVQDIDSDGDMDVLGAAKYGDDITWWENDGNENFTEHIIDGNFDGAMSVHAKDIDGDGDVDVIGAAGAADEIGWWEQEGWSLVVELTPVDPPIQIPGSGGVFELNLAVTNPDITSHVVTIWCDATLPGGNIHGPTLGPVSIPMSSGMMIERNRTQAVPANAPAGVYSYNAYAATDGDTAVTSFPLLKLELGDGGIQIDDWFNHGKSFENGYTARSPITPEEFTLSAVHPNPFNPSTTISFILPDAGKVYLSIYNISGLLVTTLVNGWRDAGSYQVTFDGSALASGVYFYGFTAGQHEASGKMLLLK